MTPILVCAENNKLLHERVTGLVNALLVPQVGARYRVSLSAIDFRVLVFSQCTFLQFHYMLVPPFLPFASERLVIVRVIFSLVLELYLASARFLRIPIYKRKDGYKWCAA